MGEPHGDPIFIQCQLSLNMQLQACTIAACADLAKCLPEAKSAKLRLCSWFLFYMVSYDWASHSHHFLGAMKSTVVWLCGCYAKCFPLTHFSVSILQGPCNSCTAACEPAVQLPMLFLLWSWLLVISAASWLQHLVAKGYQHVTQEVWTFHIHISE